MQKELTDKGCYLFSQKSFIIDLSQGPKGTSEKRVLRFMEYSAMFFRQVILEKKLKARILCSHIELSIAKLSSNYGTTVTCNCRIFLNKSIKKEQLSYKRHRNIML